MTIESMIDATIGKEGRYSNNPADPGGATCWGITERVARRNGYTGTMQALPRESAVAIYRQEYAIRPGFAAVAEIAATVGEELFDTGVNMGPPVAALWFQQALNALNNGGTLYSDIKEDGDVGPATLRAFQAFVSKRGTDGIDVMLKALNCLQGARYLELARMRGANEAFEYGWLKNRVAL